ncbi:MAG: HAD hydrolase-like protein [Fibrobacter sp.]|nr:HAD hydrolase-like protein [Fibrobacter sp.]
MNKKELSTPIDWQNVDAVVFDLDGTLYLGNELLPQALELVNLAQKQGACYFLSNNTSKTPESTWAKMQKLGLTVELSQVLSPLHTLVAHIKKSDINKCWVLANGEVLAWLQFALPQVDFKAERVETELVVLAYDDSLTYQDLCEVAWRLQDGAKYWITHPDFLCPHPQGYVPDVGGLVELFATCTQRRPEVILGKPSPIALEAVLQNYSAERVLFIGDRLYTDWQLAQNVGCQFRLSLAGETNLEMWEKSDPQPLLL